MYNDQPVCCPQFCLQCLDMNTCITCNFLTELTVVGNSTICVRAIGPAVITCSPGNYLEPITKACFSCNFPNCVSCTTYMNCTLCANGYFLNNVSQIGTNPFDPTSPAIIQVIPTCLPCMAFCNICTNSTSCNFCYA